jgi:hypothetical protein
MVREAYGESIVVAVATNELANVDPGVADAFDLDAIKAGFRLGLPDPEEEKKGGKPPALRNYRSESTEMVARGALAKIHGIAFPAHPQLGKANPNQPFLGFDGWGLLATDDGLVLTLVQVKGTDHESSPSPEAHRLAEECKAVPRDVGKLARAISLLVVNVVGQPEKQALVRMLAQLGRGELPKMVVAPVVVRGLTLAEMADLQPVRQASPEYAPAVGRGLAVSIGVHLTEFGERVMKLARAA